MQARWGTAPVLVTADLLSDVKVIGYSLDKRNLMILEAILIKKMKHLPLIPKRKTVIPC